MTFLETQPPCRPRAAMALAHGAGAPMDSDVMTALAQALAEQGLLVVRFEFPYMARRRETGRRAPPDRAPRLLECFHQAVDRLPADLPRLAAGKSLGGRMASMLAAERDDLQAAVAFGYPFVPPGRRAAPERTAHFVHLRCPLWICQGERDPFGHRQNLVPADWPPAVALDWVPDGNHDFLPRKASGTTQAHNLRLAARQISRRLARLLGEVD